MLSSISDTMQNRFGYLITLDMDHITMIMNNITDIR